MKKAEKYMIIATIIIPTIFGILLFSNTDMISSNKTESTKSIVTPQTSSSNYEYEQLITDLKDTNGNLSLEIKQLRKQLDVQSTTPSANHISDNSNLKEQLDLLEAENNKILKENRDLEKKISKLSSGSKEKQPPKSEIKTLNDKISQLEKDLKNEKSKKKKIERSEDEKRLKGDLDKSLRENQELKNEVKKLKKEVDKLKDKLKK